MSKREIVADIKIKESNGRYFDFIDSYKNIEINELVTILKEKYDSKRKKKTILDEVIDLFEKNE